MPLHMTTTLYDLIAALQEETELDEDELVVAIVTHWVRMGRITWLNAVSEFPSCFKEEGVSTGGDVLHATSMVR
jgi:hypothetical protein